MRKTNYSRALISWAVVLFLALILSCEKRDFRKAVEKNNIEAFEQFLKKHPNGKYVEPVKNILSDLYFQEALRENTISGYESYLQKFPKSKFRGRAIKNLMELLKPEVNSLTIEDISQLRALIKTDFGTIKVRFYPDKAPMHCRNFIHLAKAHYYDNSLFYLVIPGVVIQGGAPEGDPEAGPGYTIKAEFNDLQNKMGTLGMIRGEHPDSGGANFYIALTRIKEWDGNFTIFGEVEEGLEVAMEISLQESTGARGSPHPFKPIKPIVISTIEIIRQ